MSLESHEHAGRNVFILPLQTMKASRGLLSLGTIGCIISLHSCFQLKKGHCNKTVGMKKLHLDIDLPGQDQVG